MDWDKIKIFYQVAKAGSFSLAAKELNITQPALSRTIVQLEHEAKSALFFRHPRGVQLTETGTLLFEKALEMHKAFEEVREFIGDNVKEVSGSIRFVGTQGFISHWILEDLIKFTRDYPAVQLAIYGSDSQPELDLGKFDVAVREYLENRNDLVQEFLKEYHLTLYASKNYLTRYDVPLEPADLDKHRLIAYSAQHQHSYGNIDWHLRVGLTNGDSRKPVFSSNSNANLFAAAKEGIGIVSLPKGYPGIREADLVPILPDLGPKPKSYCIYPRHLQNFERIKVFVAFLKDCHARFE